MPTPPISVNFTALPARLTRTCLRRSASPIRLAGVRAADVTGNFDTLALPHAAPAIRRRPPPSTTARISKGLFAMSSLPASILEKSRISSIRERSAPPEVFDGAQVVGLLRVEIGFEQEVGHADNAVERRTEFVADGGEESAIWLSFAACARERSSARARSVTTRSVNLAACTQDFDGAARRMDRRLDPGEPARLGNRRYRSPRRPASHHPRAGGSDPASTTRGQVRAPISVARGRPDDFGIAVIGEGDATGFVALDDDVELRLDQGAIEFRGSRRHARPRPAASRSRPRSAGCGVSSRK